MTRRASGTRQASLMMAAAAACTPAKIDVRPNTTKLSHPACMTSASRTTMGAAMPPVLATEELAPSAALRTTVGNNSVVYTNSSANAEATPNLPITAVMMRSEAEIVPNSPFGIKAHSRHATPHMMYMSTERSRLPSRLSNCSSTSSSNLFASVFFQHGSRRLQGGKFKESKQATEKHAVIWQAVDATAQEEHEPRCWQGSMGTPQRT
jgi:hypothetical protein